MQQLQEEVLHNRVVAHKLENGGRKNHIIAIGKMPAGVVVAAVATIEMPMAAAEVVVNMLVEAGAEAMANTSSGHQVPPAVQNKAVVGVSSKAAAAVSVPGPEVVAGLPAAVDAVGAEEISVVVVVEAAEELSKEEMAPQTHLVANNNLQELVQATLVHQALHKALAMMLLAVAGAVVVAVAAEALAVVEEAIITLKEVGVVEGINTPLLTSVLGGNLVKVVKPSVQRSVVHLPPHVKIFLKLVLKV